MTRPNLLATIAFSVAINLAPIAGSQDASATAPPTATAPAAAPTVAVDYSQLAKPEVAASLKLTEEQKASVGQIIAERDVALATADEPSKAVVVSAASEKLKALLTEDQRRLFESLFGGKKLRFNFRNQKWAEVLDWISKESDLSLVMETAPPGTFSYSDSKDYSTSESIDLINGWLLTKGFTLVRRERMLMCLDLKGGLPEGAVPQITVEELETRSRFEFVSVLIPLEGRAPEAVLAEVKPLLGSYGKAESLAQTQQLLVYDTVQTLKLVRDIVKRVPVPAVPPGPAVEAPKPVLIVYPIQHANPAQAGEVLKQIVNGTVVVDAKALQISVNAPPAEHEKAKIIIGQLESNQGPDQQPRLQLYTVRISDPEQMLATLKLIAPDGQYRIDPVSGKLVVWASDRDHQRVSESLETLQAEQPNGGLRQLQVYPLKSIEPTSLSTLLLTMVPGARVTPNAANRSLVVIASQADHELIRSLVEQIEAQSTAAGVQKELRTYPANGTISTAAVTMLATVLPTAQVLSDTPNQRLLVMATESEHERVVLLLKSLETAADNGRSLKMYSSERIDTTSVASLLASVTPQASVTMDVVNRRMMVLATEADHAQIQKVLDQVQLPDTESVRSLKSYPLKPKTTSTTIVTLLASLAPRASVSADEVNRRLLITASEKEHGLITQVIEQVEKDAVGVQPELRFYPLVKVTGTTTLPVLQSIVPLAKITYLADGNRYSVIATVDDHKLFAATLEQLEANASEIQKTLKFYDVAAIGSADARTLLATTYPDITFVPTTEGNKLMAWVSAGQDEKVRATLEQLVAEKPFESRRRLELYSIKDLGASASTVLAAAVPRASISVGAKPDQLAIVASAEDHEKLKAVLTQLQEAASKPVEKTLAVHPLNGITPTSALQILQPLVDADVQLTLDPTGQQLFVRAPAEKQEQIREVVEKVTATGLKNTRETKTYVVGAPNADEAQEVLTALFRDATIVTDADRKMVVATATADQHKTIEQITSQMKGASLDGDIPVAAVYELKNVSATEIQTLLSSMYSRFDGVRLSVNEKTGRLVVLAKKEHQDAIKPLIEQIDQKSTTPESQPELAVFKLNQMDGLAIQTALTPLLPKNAQVTADRTGRQLFVSASAEDMPAIRELVEQVLAAQKAEIGLITRTYRLRPFEADEAMEVATRMFPDGTFVTDTSQEMLVATATEDQHKTLQQIVEQMTSTIPAQNAPEARAYRLHGVDGENAVEVFDNLFRRTDNVRTSYDTESRSLVAVARPDQHEVIKKLIEQLQPVGNNELGRTIEFYAMPNIDGTTAIEVAEGVVNSVDPAAKVSWEKTSRQLVVTTTTAGHTAILAAVDRFQQNDPREMDVLQLRTLSASSAQNAIEGLYGDSFAKDGDYPVIQADEDLQQLLIRGSKKQLQDIRTLLIKMGETGLDQANNAGNANRNLRVIPLQGDVDLTVRKIQDLWPRVRRNPIRVLTPGGASPVDEPLNAPDSSAPQNPVPPTPAPVIPESKDQPQPEMPKADAGHAAEFKSTVAKSYDDPASDGVAAFSGVETSQAAIPTALMQDESAQRAAEQQVGELSPIVIIPGVDRVTIASDDLEALDQLEAILRASTSQSPLAGSTRNRDFSIYQLRNAGAEEVSETLKSIYESRAGMLAFGSVVIVPEARMNALIVYGGRTDRDRIEQLLEILDTEKLPDSGRIFKTQVIPVKHADAADVEKVLRGVYRTEMTAGGSRRAIDIPAGIDTSVANVLRQINAASSAPLLTIEVQSETNALVIKAPQNLIDDLQELVTKLDDASATNRSRGVTLIPLRKTNSRRVMEVLDNVLD